ncbi:hypothetical protein BJX76DRAFT_337684 [Aspergillus varians]
MGFLSALSTPFSIIIVYPVYYVAFCAYFLLNLLASPFLYLGSLGLWLVLLPLRVLISLKALLIYLGVASLAGASAALILYSITTLAIDLLLNCFPSPSTTVRLKPRPERAMKGAKYPYSDDSGVNNDLWASWGWELNARPLRKGGLMSETILEEESQGSD